MIATPAYAVREKTLRSGRKEHFLSHNGEQWRRITQGGEAFYQSPDYAFDLHHFCDDKKELKRQAEKAAMKIIGRVMEAKRFGEYQKKEEQLDVMSDDVANRMERLGIGGYSNAPSVQDGRQTVMVGMMSGLKKEQRNYRRNKFIPLIAREKRGNILRELIYFVQNHEGECRHWVLHDGPRCLFGHLKSRWKKQNRTINDFNKSGLAKKYGVRVVFRANEAGSPLKKEIKKEWNSEKGRMERPYIRVGDKRVRNVDGKGRQTFHPHTHFVVHMKRFLEKHEFRRLINHAQIFFGVPMIDHGSLREPREACKYVVKLDELMELTDKDFVSFFNVTRFFHFVAAQGLLRKQIHYHRDHQIRLWMNEEGRYEPAENWNQTEFVLEETKGEKTARLAAAVKSRGDGIQILAITRPMAKFTPVYEPIIVCRGRGVTLERLLENKRVRAMYDRYQDDYRSGADGLYMTAGGAPVEVAQAALSAARGEFLLTIPPFLPATGGGAGSCRSEARAGLPLVGGYPPMSGLPGDENAAPYGVSGTNLKVSPDSLSQKAESPVACAAGLPLVGSPTGFPW